MRRWPSWMTTLFGRWAWLMLLAWGCTEGAEVLTRVRSVATHDDAGTSGRPQPSEPSQPSSVGPKPVPEPAPMPDAGVPDTLTGLKVSLVGVGEDHACALFDGHPACWGSNASGQLGLGDASDRVRPTPLNVAGGWLQIETGSQHSCGVDAEGHVYCWGANDRGQLATGDRQSRSVPTRVPLEGAAVTISTHFDHVCALLADASLWCWGQNFEGQLGQSDAFPGDQNPSGADALQPLQVTGGEWLAVATGQGHTCAIARDRSLSCWGRNSGKELGSGDEIQVRQPLRVGEDTDWARLSAGQGVSCAIKTDGTLWCWGRNIGYADDAGAPLGVDGIEIAAGPTRVGTNQGWLQVNTNAFHTCGVLGDRLWCWGRNIEGQLGLGDLDLRKLPTLVGDGYVGVATGRFLTCAWTVSGAAMCTGKNDFGELGTGDTERRSVFSAVSL